MPLTRYEQWAVQGGLLVRPGSPLSPRDLVVIGTTKPGPLTTGVLDPTGADREPITGNVTISANNTTYENKTISGNLSMTGKGNFIRNVKATKLVSTNANAEDNHIEDSTFGPDTPVNTADTGVSGHDYTLLRVKIENCIDGINIYNTNTGSTPYQSGVKLYHVWVDRLIFWTAATAGVVHPNDTWTHNDGIQHQGGWGTEIRGCLIDARFKKDAGHWKCTGNPEIEPYTPVALNSLGDGGPWWQFGNRGDGTEATGRYNDKNDSISTQKCSLAGMLIGNNVLTSRELIISQNWWVGGSVGINLGGFNYPGDGVDLLTECWLNRFSRDQGEQMTGGNDTHTIGGAGTGWSGHINSGAGTANANVYEDNGAEINFRGD